MTLLQPLNWLILENFHGVMMYFISFPLFGTPGPCYLDVPPLAGPVTHFIDTSFYTDT